MGQPRAPDSAIYDVAAIGGGLAGLAAALRAAQFGCRVIVIEQGTEELYPCNSRYAGGWFHLALHDASADADWLVDRLLGIAPDDVDHDLIEAIARNARRALGWLANDGSARFIRGGPLGWQRNLLAPPRPSRSRLVWPGRGPDLLVRSLGAKIGALGGRVVRGHCVSAIERDKGIYTTTCDTAVGQVSIRSRALVLSDGGFAADRNELTQRVSRHGDAILQRNAGAARGTSVRLAPQLGAALTETSSYYGHLHSIDAVNNADLWPYPTIDYLALAGIVVNRAGLRFIDDGRDGVALTNELSRAGWSGGAFAVFDSIAWESEGRNVQLSCRALLEQLGGTLFSGSSLSDLAVAAGIDSDGLLATVSGFNAALRGGRLARLPVPKTTANIAALEIAKPPFFAIPICPGITHTMGGVAISPTGAVRGRLGDVIPGLFAAGSAVGGAEGGRQSFYLGGLCKAAILGVLSGESAARFAAG